MAIASPSEIAAGLGAGAQPFVITKATIASQLAGGFTSLWRATGTPAQASIPGAAAVCDKTLTGALINQTNASGNDARSNPKKNYIGALDIAPTANFGSLMIVDRLAHMGGLSGVTTGNQTVGVDISGAGSNLASRVNQSTYQDARWFAEIYTAIGTTGQTCTVTYTNAAGTSGQTLTFTLGGASPANQPGRMFELIPSNGEKIKSIQTVSIGTSTGTAGSWGITALKPILQVRQAFIGDDGKLTFVRKYDVPTNGKVHYWMGVL